MANEAETSVTYSLSFVRHLSMRDRGRSGEALGFLAACALARALRTKRATFV